MKTIPLTQGQVATVCDCHAHLVDGHKWFAQFDPNTKTFYAVRTYGWFGKRKRILMHSVINNTASGAETDHINHDTLDNRCCNLRTATKSQNMMNRRKYSNNTSGYKGVSWDSTYNKWRAQIQSNGKKTHLGSFNAVEDAVRAYEDAARELHGDFARVNEQHEVAAH